MQLRPFAPGLKAATACIAAAAAMLLTPAPARPQPMPEDAWAGEVLAAVNRLRASEGLAPWTLAEPLQPIAAAHSRRMAADRRLSHDGFQARMDASGSLLCVENVAAGTTRAAVLLGAWSRTPNHRRNLLEPRVRRVAFALALADAARPEARERAPYVTLFACE